MSYQDTIDPTGAVVSAGYRECEARYEVVRQAVEGLRRPFTVLDLGAAEGYFSVRLAQEFGARVVAIDSRPVVKAIEGRVAAVRVQEMTPEDVRLLGTFDVVLALSILHHVPDWKGMLERLDRNFRSRLIVETPNPREKLRVAHNRDELPSILGGVLRRGFKQEGEAPAVWDSSLRRGIFVKERSGLPVYGTVRSGGGNNSGHVARFVDELADVLGYRPFPGSLNVKTRYAFRLGPYAAEYVDPRRGRGGRRGGDYQIWPARIEGYDGPAHVIRPGVRGHGRYCLEVWAPEKLRDVLNVRDGDEVLLRIGA